MWHIRPGESPLVTGTHTRRRSSNTLPQHPLAPAPAPKASQAHTRRQSISSTTTTTTTNNNPAPHRLDPSTVYLTPRILPRRILSLNEPGRPQGGRPLPTTNSNPNFRSAAEKNIPQGPHRYGGVNLPSVPEFAHGGVNGAGAGGKTVSNSYSLPANLTASYHNSATKRPSSRPHYPHGGGGHAHHRSSGYHPSVRVSAPQNLGGDRSSPLDDRETQSSRIVRRSFSSTSYRFLTAERPADYDPVGARKVYNYMPSGYWAGRISSIMDRLAAEYPDVALAERVKMAFGDLGVMACGPGAEQSLMEFKRAFERKMKDGKI
ncbi:uncharacterized protein H6S33_009372 [Morchella sextelata]|uniref:uncharacterized protein n=1 Tax=Morchella sextelata TaxID=1174677 RepID=UPI001D0537CE|nr:uncharacterized protein H6S33_009372 [Morchella sextelata]KAH0612992.1 hypothetical protein H6S33_009372 [Morchella sextelata]